MNLTFSSAADDDMASALAHMTDGLTSLDGRLAGEEPWFDPRATCKVWKKRLVCLQRIVLKQGLAKVQGIGSSRVLL